MAKYAEGTSVPVDRSRAEVEKILMKYGADQFSSGWTTEKAVLMFRANKKYIRIEMPLAIKSVTHDSRGYLCSESWAAQENRRRWRSMVLYVKAMLESVESQIVSFEEAFMAHIVLPNKQTVAQYLSPQIEAAYTSGDMPKQLPGY